jgi:hypothetical protein
MLPPFRSTHGDHDDESSGLKSVDRKSTHLSFRTQIPNIQGRSHLAAAFRCPMSAEVRLYAGMIGRLVAEQPHAPFPYAQSASAS